MLSRSPALVLGVATVDRVLAGHRGWPVPGERQVATSLGVFPGGNALNAACLLARLGVHTALRLALGQDADGDMLATVARDHGVDTMLIRRDPVHRTSTSAVFIDARGEPAFIHFPGANSTLGEADVRALEERIHAAPALLLAGVGLLEGLTRSGFGSALAEALSGPRRPIVFADVNLLSASDAVQWPRHLEPLAPHLDYFTPNRAEAEQITGAPTPEEAGPRLLERFPRARAVCIKDGPRGALLFRRAGAPERVPAFRVPVADTIGAGDAWSAGFIAAVLRRGENDLAACAEFANAAAAHCVQQRGATAGARTSEELAAFLTSDPARID